MEYQGNAVIIKGVHLDFINRIPKPIYVFELVTKGLAAQHIAGVSWKLSSANR